MDLFDDHLRFCVAMYMGNITTLLSLRKLDKSWRDCVLQIVRFQIMTLYPSFIPLPAYTLSMSWLIHRRVYGFGIRMVCPDGSHTYTMRKQINLSTRMVLGRKSFQTYTDDYYISRRHVEFSFEGVSETGGIGMLKCLGLRVSETGGIGMLKCLGLNGCVIHHNYPTTNIKCHLNQGENYMLGFYDKIEISERHFLYVEPIVPHRRFLVI